MNKHFLRIATGTLSIVIFSNAEATVSEHAPMFDAPNIRMLSENGTFSLRKNRYDDTNIVNQKADRDTVTKLKLSKSSEKTVRNNDVFCQGSQATMKAETEFSLDLVQAGRISSIEDSVEQILSNIDIERNKEIIEYNIQKLLENKNLDRDFIKDLIEPLNDESSDIQVLYTTFVNLLKQDE